MVVSRPTTLRRSPLVTLSASYEILFNAAATNEYDLGDFVSFMFSLIEDNSKMRFDFLDSMDKTLFSCGFRSFKARGSRLGSRGRGGTRFVEEMVPPMREIGYVKSSYPCTFEVKEHADHSCSLPSLYIDLVKDGD
jgi:hypothetical protein